MSEQSHKHHWCFQDIFGFGRYNNDNVGVMRCADALTTPVIHEHHAKDVLVGFLDGNGLPKLSLPSNKEGLIKVKRKCESIAQ